MEVHKKPINLHKLIVCALVNISNSIIYEKHFAIYDLNATKLDSKRRQQQHQQQRKIFYEQIRIVGRHLIACDFQIVNSILNCSVCENYFGSVQVICISE